MQNYKLGIHTQQIVVQKYPRMSADCPKCMGYLKKNIRSPCFVGCNPTRYLILPKKHIKYAEGLNSKIVSAPKSAKSIPKLQILSFHKFS